MILFDKNCHYAHYVALLTYYFNLKLEIVKTSQYKLTQTPKFLDGLKRSEALHGFTSMKWRENGSPRMAGMSRREKSGKWSKRCVKDEDS